MRLRRLRGPARAVVREEALVPPAPADPRPPWQEAGIHGIARAREWDVTVTVEAPDIDGNAVRWVGLPDGTILVEEGPDAGLEPLAAAVERRQRPPYRARAARQVGEVWAAQATRIEVLALPHAPPGETIELTRRGSEQTLAVDGVPSFGSVLALEERGEREGPDYAVRAERLEGDLWEIRVAPL